MLSVPVIIKGRILKSVVNEAVRIAPVFSEKEDVIISKLIILLPLKGLIIRIALLTAIPDERIRARAVDNVKSISVNTIKARGIKKDAGIPAVITRGILNDSN